MKKLSIIILIMLSSSSVTLDCRSFKTRACYFFTPSAVAYCYPMLLHLLYGGIMDRKHLKALQYNYANLLLFQGLTYYCWSQAFAQDQDNHSPITVTVSRY